MCCTWFLSTAALMALKRKKRLEKQLQQIDGTLSTIEFQRDALENAGTNAEVLKNMSYAAKALKAAHQQLYVFQSCIHSTCYTFSSFCSSPFSSRRFHLAPAQRYLCHIIHTELVPGIVVYTRNVSCRDVDDVHEMMDDIQEQTELADEISRAISEPAGFGMDFDEVQFYYCFHQDRLRLTCTTAHYIQYCVQVIREGYISSC